MKSKTVKLSIIVKKIGMLIALVFVMGAPAQSVLAQNLDRQNLVRFSGGIGDITTGSTNTTVRGPVDRNVGDLQMVAEFKQQVVGVAVSASGRVFVSFPRNGIDTVKTSVAEVVNGNAVAYPNKEINTLNTAAPRTHFLSAQSVFVDSSDTLWVLDVGNLGSGTPLISGGAKLVAIDLTTNAVKR